MDPSTNDTAAAFEAGVLSAMPQSIDGEGRFHSILKPAGASHEVVDLEQLRDASRDRPRRKTGVFNVRTAEAFIAYLEKHGDTEETEVWATEAEIPNRVAATAFEAPKLVAVINAHGPDAPGHGDHRLVLTPTITPAWAAWLGRDRQMVAQIDFAEFIEDRQLDIVAPPAATMLELAQSFQAHRGAAFESAKRLSTGEVNLVYRETTSASAGHKGDISIPEQFTLGLEPIEGAGGYRIIARFRYRLREGELKLGYVLDRPDEVMRKAFQGFIDEVESATEYTVWPGLG